MERKESFATADSAVRIRSGPPPFGNVWLAGSRWCDESLSDCEFKIHRNFVHVGPFRQVQGLVLKHDAPVVIHNEANGGFARITSFSLPDHFHSYVL